MKAQTASILLLITLLLGFCTGTLQATKIACVGDSITFGATISNKARDSYPAQLNRLLKQFDNKYEVRNFGRNGATLLRRGDRPYIQQTQYSQAISWNPDIVIIMLGTNDTKPFNWNKCGQEYVEDYINLIDRFSALSSKPKIWICKPVPVFRLNSTINNKTLIQGVIPGVETVALQRNVSVMDLYTPLLNASAHFSDGIHPNAAGAGIMARTIASILMGIRLTHYPDFNADGTVNFTDYTLLLNHYASTDTNAVDDKFDLAPGPDGDKVIDLLDMTAFLKYWLNTANLVAQWNLDESEGIKAKDLLGNAPGTVFGNPIWQPLTGKIDGAVKLDGIDDYIQTDFVLDPAKTVFTVFAWVKGNIPTTSIIAQISSKIWIGTDTLNRIYTGLRDGSRSTKKLVSDFVLNDSQWHQIRLVWDGSLRHIYVDNLQVACDTKPLSHLLSAKGGLRLGASGKHTPDSFWMGMIDDVRIYNKVLLPPVTGQ